MKIFMGVLWGVSLFTFGILSAAGVSDAPVEAAYCLGSGTALIAFVISEFYEEIKRR